MKPKDEQKDLIKNPLPTGMSDEHLPSTLYDLETEIASLEEAIYQRRELYAGLMIRAVQTKTFDEGAFHIVAETRNLPRKINSDVFHDKHPNEYALAVAIENNEKIQGAINVLLKIDLTDSPDIKVRTAQALLAERMVDEICYPHEIKKTYRVERRPITEE